MEREEYIRRWSMASDALAGLVPRLAVVTYVALTAAVCLQSGTWLAAVWMGVGALTLALFGVGIAAAYASDKAHDARRYSHFWQESYREPWFVPTRKDDT